MAPNATMVEKHSKLTANVRGYLSRSNAAFWDLLLNLQQRFGIHGNMMEIGVYLGRSALMFLLHRDASTEHCILVDINIEDRVRQAKENIPAPMRKNLDFLIGDSRQVVRPEAFKKQYGGFRWIHIDGGHSYEVVKADLINCEQLLQEDGIICCDDFFNERYPQIAGAVFEFCLQHPEKLSFLAVGDNKCYLVRPSFHELYYQTLLVEAEAEMKRRNIATTIFEGEVTGAKCLGVRPIRKAPIVKRSEIKDVLAHAKKLGFRPRTVIDVGVAYGTPGLYGAFDDVKYLLVEPLAEYENVLKDICRQYPAEYVLAAAGAQAGALTLNVHPDLSGSSLFKECEGPEVDGAPREVPVVTLDNLCAEKKLPGPYLLKIDTQGADLQVLAGAEKVLQETELVLLEAFLFQFYQGIPQLHDVVAFMQERGFVVYDVFGGNNRLYDDALAQLDLAFVKQDGMFRQTHVFATPEQRAAFREHRRRHLNPAGHRRDSAAQTAGSAAEIAERARQLGALLPGERIERILLMRSAQLDVVQDAAAALAAAWPDARIEALCQPAVAGDVSALPNVAELHLYDQGFFDVTKIDPAQLALLQERKYDLLALIYSNDAGEGYWDTQILARRIRPAHILSFNRRREWGDLNAGAKPSPGKGGVITRAIEERIAALKDIHRGRRAFILGMGPSLRSSDLDRLHGEITFACNKIYLAFDRTDWRPTYYSVIDLLVAKNNYPDICRQPLTKIYTHPLQTLFSEETDVTYVLALRNPGPPDDPQIQFSKDLLHGTYGGHTVIYFQLQLAWHMGIREIYLLGLDFHFEAPKPTGEKTAHGEDVLIQTGQQNHFHPDYRRPGEKWSAPQLDYQRRAFECAKRTFEEAGGRIWNASRQTALNVFPRVDFDDISPAGEGAAPQ